MKKLLEAIGEWICNSEPGEIAGTLFVLCLGIAIIVGAWTH